MCKLFKKVISSSHNFIYFLFENLRSFETMFKESSSEFLGNSLGDGKILKTSSTLKT